MVTQCRAGYKYLQRVLKTARRISNLTRDLFERRFVVASHFFENVWSFHNLNCCVLGAVNFQFNSLVLGRKTSSFKTRKARWR
jgi:hypothetical protein